MDSSKLAVKFFVEDAAALPVEGFVPVFHRWIQGRALSGHQLIDVADYKHVPEGPGTVLVSHEANIHADLGEGRLGLLYFRKQPLSGSFTDRLRAVFKHGLQAAVLLQEDPALGTRIRFCTDDAIFRVYDRLHAPNSPQTFAAVRGELESFLRHLYGAPVELTHRPDPERLFEVAIKSPSAVPITTLLERVQSA